MGGEVALKDRPVGSGRKWRNRDSLEVPDIILLDIGGVLTPDPWQTLLLTVGDGIADRLSIDRCRASEAAERIWPEFSLSKMPERDWWDRLSQQLMVPISTHVVRAVEAELLRPFDGASQLLEDARGLCPTGLISDNTAFWYRKQSRMLRFSAATTASLRFLSFEQGLSKTSRPGLFELAAERLKGKRVLVLDDCQANCDRAREVGFHARLARPTPGPRPG